MTAFSPETERFAIDDCSIALHDIRSWNRRPVVFLHGIGCSKAVWSRVLGRLPDEWRLIAYDNRGAGESRESSLRPLSLDLYASDLRALLHARGVEDRPVIVGHSLGASVALQFALTWPDVPAALVLLGAEAGLCRLGAMMQDRAAVIAANGMRAWIEGPWRNAPPFSETSRAAEPELMEIYAQMLYQTGAERYTRAVTAIVDSPDLTGSLGRIDLPVLVLIGGDDDRTLPRFGWELAERLPNGDGVELPKIGHTLPMEAPERVAEELIAFVTANA
jgi:pimeloyl-ACP methyl ester carboxylesterase